ncbi:MAG: translation initiation factor IF-2 [Patescibacteria group bacterium]
MSTSTQKKLVRRPPVVVVMGHIDHGKSTLLDYIRKSNIVAGEAGGITQHMGAYQAEHTGADGVKHAITFLDTPGHEAFCTIRERGAKSADIAILVVSAEDGVKPQTIEALNTILENKIPYIVAINKIDKPNANVDRAKQSLGEHEIYVEGWGGTVPCVPISALQGTGVSELLDMILLMAELADLSAETSVPASGIIIESELDTRTGISATTLVQNGTLRIGTCIVAGGSYAPVRFIENFLGKKIDSASPSMPAHIVGWTSIPVCGLLFVTVESKKEAEKITAAYQEEARRTRLATPTAPATPAPRKTAADDVFNPNRNASADEVITFPIVIKADTIGSLDGIHHELKKITHDKVRIKIVAEGIGEINENDIKLALSDTGVTLIGFNVSPDKKAAGIIERMNVSMKTFTIIYELAQFIRAEFMAKVPKEYIDEVTGEAKILALFSHEKDRQVLGGKVQTGTINTGNDVRIMRRGTEIGRGKIRELQTKKIRASEVAEGHEFGALIEAKIAIAVGDRVEAVHTIEKKS